MPFIDSKVTVPVTPEKKEAIKAEFGQAISLLHKSETYHPVSDWGWNGANF